MAEKRGRKRKECKAEYSDLIISMSKEGKHITQFCAQIGICRDLYYDWIKMYPDFSAAAAEAQEHREQWWIEEGVKNLDNRQFNSRLYELMMMNINKWNRKTEEKHDVTVKTHEERLKDLA